ncbi:unnamed protein product [Heterosigma akashiwo]
MIAAVEKQKMVYVMNRDASSRLTISSPLEAHKAQTIVYSVCGVDVGFENPIFAAIELDYSEADQDATGEAVLEAEKHLTYYELDLGLNHVTRKWSEPIARTANLLLAVPGGQDGPGGVLVVAENWVAYKHMAHPEPRSPLPSPAAAARLLAARLLCRRPASFLVSPHTPNKVTLETAPDNLDEVRDVKVAVFDTLPVASALCITRTGLLFAASEFGNHHLFHILQAWRGDPDTVAARRAEDPELGDDALSAAAVAPLFAVRARPRNLALFDEVDEKQQHRQHLAKNNNNGNKPQVYALCGRGNRSSLRVLRHGIAVHEVVVSEMPGHPSAVWTVKGRKDDEHDKYIVVSFTNATLVLSIGETVEEVADSGFLAAVPTLAVALLDDNSTLQAGDDCAIHEKGIRHLRADARPAEWKTPGKKTLERAAANGAQLAVALAGGEVIYFELDASGALAEVATRELGVEVACLDVGEPPEGRVKSAYLVVGGYDDTVRVLSLDPAQGPLLEQKAALTLPARAESLCLTEMAPPTAHQTMTLHAGLANGTAQRATLDLISGTLSDPRTRFLGSRPVRLFRTKWAGRRGARGGGSRPWLSHAPPAAGGRPVLAPLSYPQLDYAATFASEQARRALRRAFPPPDGLLCSCPEGIVAVAGGTLRILTLARLGDLFNQTAVPLRYTPRRMCPVPNTDRLLIVECDQNEFNAAEREKIEAEVRNRPDPDTAGASQVTSRHHKDIRKPKAVVGAFGQQSMWSFIRGGGVGKKTVMEEEEEDEEGAAAAAPAVRGPAPPTEGKWASCVRAGTRPAGGRLELLEMGDNENTLTTHTVSLTRNILVLLALDRQSSLLIRCRGLCFLHVYRLIEDRLVPLHRTPVEEVPLALAEFQGRLLAGVGKSLRVYDLGKKKLLRKCENKTFPTMITDIKVQGDRIYVSDMMESFHLACAGTTSLAVLAGDQVPSAGASCLLDYDTVAGPPRFGACSRCGYQWK